MPFCCFDGSICVPKNKLCPNDGTPVGCINKLAPALALAALNGGNAPGADPPPGVMADARNGFAAPAPTPKPVACGRSPTPIEEEPPPNAVSPPGPALVKGELVGCAERPKLPPGPAPPPLVPVPTPIVGDDTPLKLAPSPIPAGTLTPLVPVVPAGGDTAAGTASSAGVVGTDCGIGGSASRSDAPNDDVGLKALTPALYPVACGRNGAPVGWLDSALDSAVLPVGCPPSELKSGSEKVDPEAVVVGVEGLVLDEPKEVNDEVVG